MENFIKWQIAFGLIVCALVTGVIYDVHLLIWNSDITYISTGIFTLFALCSFRLGYDVYHTYRANHEPLLGARAPFFGYPIEKDKYNEVNEWFLILGLVGTMVGFAYLVLGFAGLDIENKQTIVEAIQQAALGAATAIYTTIVGALCSLALRIQLMFYDTRW